MAAQVSTSVQCVEVPVADQGRAEASFEQIRSATKIDTELQP
jgi:hypothetical protein